MGSLQSERTADADGVELISLNLAMPAFLGRHLGRPVESGFKKQPVDVESVAIGLTNIAGDGQADLTVHGGAEKAIYAYSADRHKEWIATIPGLVALPPAYFGENLTVAGWIESDVRIGDVWSWGSARLQVCQPRWPCFKLALASGRTELGKVMLQHGWTGWYFRVLTPGEALACDPIRVTERSPENVTVFDAHSAMLPGAEPDLIGRVTAAPALAANWRRALQRNLEAQR